MISLFKFFTLATSLSIVIIWLISHTRNLRILFNQKIFECESSRLDAINYRSSAEGARKLLSQIAVLFPGLGIWQHSTLPHLVTRAIRDRDAKNVELIALRTRFDNVCSERDEALVDLENLRQQGEKVAAELVADAEARLENLRQSRSKLAKRNETLERQLYRMSGKHEKTKTQRATKGIR